jgi:hypothetical protein
MQYVYGRREPFDVTSWSDLLGQYRRFLETIGATEDFASTAFFISPIRTEDPESVEKRLQRETRLDSDKWLYATSKSESPSRQSFIFALPSRRTDEDACRTFPWVDVHSRLTAWWLVSAWRSLELSEATLAQIERRHTSAAAACARSLLETVATHWADARDLARLWEKAKVKAPTKHKVGDWRRMSEQLWEIQYGGRFDGKVPNLKKLFSGLLERKNALSHVDKLAKVVDGDLQSDYQWLCNTVHPSIGATLAFSTPLQPHKTRTHSVAWFSSSPVEVRLQDAVLREPFIEPAMTSVMEVGLHVALQSFEASLALVDDVGLTTGAPSMAIYPYWRNLAPSDRNQACSCGSGKKWKACGHRWGESGPSIPAEFRQGR